MKHIDLTLPIDDTVTQVLKKDTSGLAQLGHLGTHLDTYLRTTIPINYMLSTGVLFDVSYIKNRDIELEDFDHTLIQQKQSIFFRTDTTKNIAYGSKIYFTKHPQLSNKAIEYLLEQDLKFIGIDAAGLRCGKEHMEIDTQFEKNKTYVIENLVNLDQISDQTFQSTILWIALPNQTGLPCRVIATI